MIANFLGFMRKVIRVHTDTVPAHKAGTKVQEVPLGACCIQNRLGVDVHPVEDLRQLVDQGNIDIALTVLDDFGRFGDANAIGAICAGGNNAGIKRINLVGRLCRRTRGYFDDIWQASGFIAGIDPLRTISNPKIHIESET